MIELGLQRISRLLSNTPLPWKAIHIAGTNGKGSVCAYISQMLNEYNKSRWRERTGHPVLKHGRFTSPHIVDRWDGISLSKDDTIRTVPSELFHRIEKEVVAFDKQESINASEFELLTATAFATFTASELDVAVVETGMGGRLDATNVLGQPVFEDDGTEKAVDMSTFRPLPLVTAITKIGLDHQAYLGDTIEAIAKEKAGIFKPGVPVLYDRTNQPSVRKVLKESATDIGFSSQILEAYDPTGQEAQTTAMLRNNFGPEQEHIAANAQVAFEAGTTALLSLGRIGTPTESSEDIQKDYFDLINNIKTAYKSVKYAGRQEWIDISDFARLPGKHMLLDGAHNAQSAEVLGKYVDTLRGRHKVPVTWLVAASDTKDVVEILRPMLRPEDNIITTEFRPVDGMPWVKPMPAQQILDAASQVSSRLVHQNACTDPEHALQTAIAVAGSDGTVVAAGSLYLVGDIHRLLKAQQ